MAANIMQDKAVIKCLASLFAGDNNKTLKCTVYIKFYEPMGKSLGRGLLTLECILVRESAHTSKTASVYCTSVTQY